MILLHSELLLGPASSLDCPIFPSSITPRDDEVATLANERGEQDAFLSQTQLIEGALKRQIH